MKNRKFSIPLSICFLISAICLLTLPCFSATYTLIGERHLRKYTAASPSQVYNAETDAQEIVNNLCYVDWVRSFERDAAATSHTESQLDANVANRDKFDAALFCAYHTNGTHVAYANAAVYRYRLPDGALPLMTSLSAYVSSDPYNTLGARIVLMTNATGDIPTDCATCRGDVAGGIKAAGVAPRITRTVSGKNYWYPASSNVVFSSSNGLSTGLQLQKYLFVFVLMENYATSRGNWIEGCSYLANSVRITTSSAIPGWTDGSTVDLSFMNISECDEEHDDIMACYETTRTVVVCTNSSGKSASFLAPEFAYSRIHRLDTNPALVDRSAFRYGDEWAMGTNVTLSSASGMTVMSVLPRQKVLVLHDRVMAERGFEPYPPTKEFTDSDRDRLPTYLTSVGKPARTLDHAKSDFDGDGVPDGWELYVGTDPANAADAAFDLDGDGLSLVREYDHGYFPTNPHDRDTDHDGVLDRFATVYHLKGDDAEKDFDGDGLSNYEEYLASEVFHFKTLDPDCEKTGDGVVDRYWRVGDMYLGEIFGRYPVVTNSGPATVTLTLSSPTTGKATVCAWNETLDKDFTGRPEATWEVDVEEGTKDYVLTPERIPKSRFRPGRYTFVAYIEGDESDDSRPFGKPFGCVRNVDVGWSDAHATIGLTVNHPLPRLSLKKALELDLKTNATVSVKVVRIGVDDAFADPETGFGRYFNRRVVMDKEFERNGRSYICEADFITNGVFDIDWGTLTDEVVDKFGKPIPTVAAANLNVTNMSYLIVIGEGDANFIGSFDTNTTRYAISTMVMRRFENNRSKPVAQDIGIVHSERPTFTWSMPNEDKWASRFGTTYTAFKIQVLDESGRIVYDSKLQRTPAQNQDGSFTWTADAYAGDQTGYGEIFSAHSNYLWRVCMYNSKFRDESNMEPTPTNKARSDYKEYWSDTNTLSTAVNVEKDVNDNGYGAVNVTVKYAGPTVVLDECDHLSGTRGTVHVQAFATADFSGEPVSQVYTDNRVALTNLSDAASNARLIGLPMTGTYYVRAYIDSNGNRVKDDWESWGYAKESVSFAGRKTSPSVGLFIEDADTDNDLIPDAYEYAMVAGWGDDFNDIKSEFSSSVDSLGRIVFTGDYNAFTNGVANFSSGIDGSSLSFFLRNDVSAFLPTNAFMTVEDLRSIVERNVANAGESPLVKAASVNPSASKVYVYANGETQTDTSGIPFSESSTNLDVVVSWRESPDGQWSESWTYPLSVGEQDYRKEVGISNVGTNRTGRGILKVNVIKHED